MMSLVPVFDISLRRSSKAIHKATTKRAVWRSGTAPDPRLRVTIELGRSEAGGVGDVGGVGERDAREGLATEDPPPALDQVEPG